MKTVGRSGYVLLAVTLLWIMPEIAEAGRIDIWAHEFGHSAAPTLSTAESELRFFCDGTVIRGVGVDGCWLFAPVKLPVGKTVTRFRLYTYGNDGSAYTSATLARRKIGTAVQGMANVVSVGATALHAETDRSIFYPTVEKDYLYFVQIYVDNQQSYISGVRVHYR